MLFECDNSILLKKNNHNYDFYGTCGCFTENV